MKKSNQNFTIQTTFAFANDLSSCIEQAKKRVWIKTLGFHKAKLASIITPSLIEAAKRDVDTKLYIDWYSKSFPDDKAKIFPELSLEERKSLGKQQEDNDQLIESIKDAGVKVTFTNPPKSIIGRMFPASGRNHCKFALVDNTIWIGGVNFGCSAEKPLDFMVKLQDPIIVRKVWEHIPKIVNSELSADFKTQLTPEHTLLIDAGKPRQSITYEEALKMTERAHKMITYTSQFTPQGKLLSAFIKKSNQGVSVEIITSPQDSYWFTTFPYSIQYKLFKLKTKSNDNIKLFRADKTVHAKLLMIDDKEVLFGSHNLAEFGVFIGTKELSVKSSNKELISQFQDLCMDLKRYE